MNADLIVIGAGPSGMTAALYALRSGKSVLVLESDNIGGQIAFSPRVENFPSIKVIAGSELADNMFEQITALGANMELEKATSVEREGKGFKVITEYGEHHAKSVIIAAGVKHRHFGLPREQQLIGHGVSYCAVCDGAFYTGEDVALIGDANTALQYAILLSNYCKSVTVLTLFNRFFADDVLVKILKSKENVNVIHEVELKEYLGDTELSGLVFKRKDGSTFEINPKAVFVAIGQIPDNKAFENLVELDKNGFIKSDESCKTSADGVFVAGDCRTKSTRQLTTAVADGAVAALGAVRYIDENF